MTAQTRVGTAARAFCIAAVLGMSLVLRDTVALQGTLMLAAIAATATAAQLSAAVPERAVLFAEAALSALVIGLLLPQAVVLLPYLVIPALLAGHLTGIFHMLLVVSIEVLSLTAVGLLVGQASQVEWIAELVGPWLLTSLGVGLVSGQLRSIRGPAHDPSDSYESARRLLSQLRVVARRLSSGLDPVGISAQLLGIVHARSAATNSAIFVSTDGQVLAPLGYLGSLASQVLTADTPLVSQCLSSAKPVQQVQPAGSADRRHLVAWPLRVGTRTIGVLLVEAREQPSSAMLAQLSSEIDDYALRLDAALAFDEIRSLATIEERHRIAREIHDGIAQEIASLGYVLDDLTASATSEIQRKKLQDLRGELSRVVSELRLSIFDLRSEVSTGLGSALTDYVREVGARSGMTVHTTLDVAPARLRPDVETELFRIVQEAITNARKHSGAHNLWVDCTIKPPSVVIKVRDDGAGMGQARVDSFGLKVMKERADRISARLTISGAGDSQGGGTVVAVSLGDVESIGYSSSAVRGDPA